MKSQESLVSGLCVGKHWGCKMKNYNVMKMVEFSMDVVAETEEQAILIAKSATLQDPRWVVADPQMLNADEFNADEALDGLEQEIEG